MDFEVFASDLSEMLDRKIEIYMEQMAVKNDKMYDKLQEVYMQGVTAGGGGGAVGMAGR